MTKTITDTSAAWDAMIDSLERFNAYGIVVGYWATVSPAPVGYPDRFFHFETNFGESVITDDPSEITKTMERCIEGARYDYFYLSGEERLARILQRENAKEDLMQMPEFTTNLCQ